MDIPEEILTKTDKELKQLLVDDPKKATYFTNSGILYKVIGKVKGRILLQKLHNNFVYMTTMPELISKENSWLPFTFARYKEQIIASRFNNLGKLSVDKFVKYLTAVISHVKEEQHFDINILGEDSVDLVVHYPEVTISNSIEMSHLMRDIYVRYYFVKGTTWALSGLSIGRTTFTNRELSTNYIFSHCSGYYKDGYTDQLCYGNNTPIGELRESLTRSLYNLAYFFVLFDQYLQWESIEGTPYRYIEKIYNNSNSFPLVAINIEKEQINELVIRVLSDISEFTYSYSFDEDTQIIELSRDSVDEIDNLLTEYVDESERYVRVNNLSGDYYVDDSYMESEGRTTDIYWKGEAVPIHIIKDTEIVSNKKVHVDILHAVVNRITKAFEEFLITETI
jgi:hypothetical protein